MLCYTGKTRLSAGIIDDQVSSYIQARKDVIEALDQTKELAIAMKNAILLGKINDFGSLLHEAWNTKKRFSARITDPNIDELYETARQNGAIGGKLLGAGGGGFMIFLVPPERQEDVKGAIPECEYVPFKFESYGTQIIFNNDEDVSDCG